MALPSATTTTTTYHDDGDGHDDDDDEDEDDDDDERGVSRATHTRGGGVCGRYDRTKGLFAPLGGLERLRHPTSLTILHRACASKAAHTATHPLILTCSDALSPRETPLHPRPGCFRTRGTLRFVESAFRGSLAFVRKKKRKREMTE